MTYLEQDLNMLADYIAERGLDKKTILITGATGLLGSLAVKAVLWANEKHNTQIQVVAMARTKERVKAVFKEKAESPYLRFVYQDIIDSIEIGGQVDYIIHTANSTTSKYFITNPVETMNSIYTGSRNVLEFAKDKKVQGLVYLSSMEVFGATDPNKRLISEKDLGYLDISNIRSCYSEGKRLVECMCKCYAEEYGVPVKIARLAQTFGAGISKDENRVFAQFARSAMNKTDIVLHTKGDSTGNYCYTADALKAIFLLLNAGENGEAYTVVNEESTMTIAEMAQMVARDIAGEEIQVVFDIPEGNVFGYAPKTSMRLSAQKLRELGWSPTVDLKNTYLRMMQGL